MTGDVTLDGNTTLTSLDGLFNIRSIGGDLNISNNPALSQAEIDRFIAALGAENVAGMIYMSGNGP